VIDGHGSHMSVEFCFMAKMHKIWLHFLPPHSSHITQPLDVTCFSPLKTLYRQIITDLAALDDASKVKKERFLAAYKDARDKALLPRTIRNGFKATGLFPYAPEVVLQSRFVPQSPQKPKTPPKRTYSMAFRQLEGSPTTPKSYKQMHRTTINCTSQKQQKSLRKAGRFMDYLTTEITLKHLKIQQLEAKISGLITKKKRRKVAIDPTNRFANVEAIKLAQDAANALDKKEAELDAKWLTKHPLTPNKLKTIEAQEAQFNSWQFSFRLEAD
jgi:hypothetical protein